MRNLILVIIIFFLSQNLLAQVLDRNYLIQNFGLKENTIILINGEIFKLTDTLRTNNYLKKLNSKLIVGITSIKNEGQIGCANNDVVIVEYPTELPKKIIEEKLKELKVLFKDEYHGFSQNISTNAKDPVLYINNQKIYHTEIKNVLAKLEKKDIAYISIKTTPQSQENHGQNALNGIVVIWTSQGLKKASS